MKTEAQKTKHAGKCYHQIGSCLTTVLLPIEVWLYILTSVSVLCCRHMHFSRFKWQKDFKKEKRARNLQ